MAVMDIAWGLGFVMVALVGYLHNIASLPKALLLIMVSCWGLRLAWYMFKRTKSQGEDPRYMAWRKGWGDHEWREGYVKVFLAQGLFLFLISLPVQLGMSSELERFGAKQILGFLIWAAGFALEAWADWHLARFKTNPANKGKICTDGPWKYVRFPNYLGEMVLWVGVYLFIFGFWTAWTIIGPIALCYAIIKVTGIPPQEERYRGRVDYEEYAKRVPRLIPFLKP